MFWAVLLGGLLIVSGAVAFLLSTSPADTARIYQDGVLIMQLDLADITEARSFVVEHGFGVNVLAVERGRIRIAEADCPDGYCVRQGWVGGGSIPIVCLPNRLVVRLEGTNDLNIDASVG